ncbi:DinB family protein [Bacillus toyonensis]|uniref:DinB family protein n=1 Tax=Bacillus toyonensis TaxID=155322 RepID=UPI00156DD4EB|nr:DinB family protein [Bacillus toyonensis]MDF9448762.1 DinB family protein [Bacillus toyonensis]MDG1563621.1 DinB family protein [Bacillus toyonensis]NSL67876.1 DinB family protein [Bacillus toyonensis]
MTKNVQIYAVESIYDSINKIKTIVKSLPEEIIRWKPSKDEWSVMQIITHVAEAIPYWAKEISNIKLSNENLWGRGLTDEVRLQAVSEENINRKTVEEVIEQLSSIPITIENVLHTLTDEELHIQAPSRNPRFENKPINFIVNHLIVEHTEKHYKQIDRNVSKYNQDKGGK